MAAKAGAFASWKESHTLLSQREDNMPSPKGVSQAKQKPKLCLDLSLCCRRNMANSVDSPLSEKQLLGGNGSRWVVTENDSAKQAVSAKGTRGGEGDGLFSRSGSVREARSGGEESWFSQTFRRPRKQDRQEVQDVAGNHEERPAPGHTKKPSWDGPSTLQPSQVKSETGVRARAAGAASWWGENPAEKEQEGGIAVKDPSSFRNYSRSGSVLNRSASTKKRTHEVIYSGDAKWKKVIRRVLKEARKIHLPAVSIQGPYNYDMLNYMKNFDICPDDDARPIRFRSLSSASEFQLQAELAAQLDGIRSDDEREISEERSPARRSSRAVGIAVASVSPIHLIQ